MNKKTSPILIFGGLGILAVLGFLATSFFSNKETDSKDKKKNKPYVQEYEQHGVEYYAMR